ncbi:MAG: endolytic transglycosylase MltG [Ardenticatenaceae bacterium]
MSDKKNDQSPFEESSDNQEVVPGESEELRAEKGKRLRALNEQLAELQIEIRETTKRRIDAQRAEKNKDVAVFERQLATLRQERQTLFEEQFGLHRELTSSEEQPPVTLKLPPKADEPRKRGVLAKAALFLFRLLIILVVFGGIAFLSIGVIGSVTDYLQPPSIEEVMADEQNKEVSIFEAQTIEERVLALYLILNSDVVESPASDDLTPVIFRIEAGENATTIAERLQEVGLISDEGVFRRLLQYRGADQSLDAGVYELSANMTMDQIIVTLEEGRLQEISFTFLEGWRAEQMASLLEESGILSAEEYMALVRDPSRFDFDFLRDLPPGSTLEGYLFPDTYIVIKAQANAENIIRTQLQNFDRRITPELRAALPQNNMTLHQAVIFASLVEREAVVSEEREIIAGVYINRWQDGTVLNADPTIQYALGYQEESGQWWKRPLTAEDLRLDSSYNSYTRAGLPPTAIANPGLDSIRSSILAPKTEYYYFVSRNDGTHIFAATYEEHLQNVAQYQSGN